MLQLSQASKPGPVGLREIDSLPQREHCLRVTSDLFGISCLPCLPLLQAIEATVRWPAGVPMSVLEFREVRSIGAQEQLSRLPEGRGIIAVGLPGWLPW